MVSAGLLSGVLAYADDMPWFTPKSTPEFRTYTSTSSDQLTAAKENPIELKGVEVSAKGAAPVNGAANAAQSTDVENFSVYTGVDADGTTQYVGISGREPEVRWVEHAKAVGTGKENLQYSVVPGSTNLSKIDARIMEQNFINKYGLDKLLNKRNSIAPKYWINYGIKKD
ncbi:MAG: hypothetical protein EOP51_09220 [Sphingobacteriales bacterium]|nr:MAG: hypothetical protein EOP51_09220 [Sphingobacteriales bacterium]